LEISQGLKGGPLEPWSPESFAMKPGAQSLLLLGARTKMMILGKWSPQYSHGTLEPHFFCVEALEPYIF